MRAAKQVAKKASKKPAAKARRPPSVLPSIAAREVEGPPPYLEVTIHGQVTDRTVLRVFERIRKEIVAHDSNRLLLDMREGSIALTISDLLELTKAVISALAGVLDRFAVVLRKADMPAEKFFEPSLSNRGLLTLVTLDYDEATYWLSLKHKPVR